MKKRGTMFHQASQTKSAQSNFLSHHDGICMQFEHFGFFLPTITNRNFYFVIVDFRAFDKTKCDSVNSVQTVLK